MYCRIYWIIIRVAIIPEIMIYTRTYFYVTYSFISRYCVHVVTNVSIGRVRTLLRRGERQWRNSVSQRIYNEIELYKKYKRSKVSRGKSAICSKHYYFIPLVAENLPASSQLTSSEKIIFISYIFFLIIFWNCEKRDTKDTLVSRHMKIKPSVIYYLCSLENRERDTTKSYNVRFLLHRDF